jgi:hypothetical protein
MESPKQRLATRAALAAVLLLAAPACAALLVGPDGKPVRRETGRVVQIGKGSDAACKAPPADRAIVFNLARETRLVDAVDWISPIICRAFLVPDRILAKDKRVTMVAPERMTASEAYRFFLGALDSVALGVEPSGKFLRVVEAGTVPHIVEGAAFKGIAVADPYVTLIVRLRDLSPAAQAQLLRRQKGETCDCLVFAPDTIVLTDRRSKLEPLLGRRILIGR